MHNAFNSDCCKVNRVKHPENDNSNVLTANKKRAMRASSKRCGGTVAGVFIRA